MAMAGCVPFQEERDRPGPRAERVRRIQPGVFRSAYPGRDHRGDGVHPGVLAAREHAAVIPAGYAAGGHVRLVYLYYTMIMPRSGGRLRAGITDTHPVLRILFEFLPDFRVPDLDRVQFHLHAVG